MGSVWDSHWTNTKAKDFQDVDYHKGQYDSKHVLRSKEADVAVWGLCKICRMSTKVPERQLRLRQNDSLDNVNFVESELHCPGKSHSEAFLPVQFSRVAITPKAAGTCVCHLEGQCSNCEASCDTVPKLLFGEQALGTTFDICSTPCCASSRVEVTSFKMTFTLCSTDSRLQDVNNKISPEDASANCGICFEAMTAPASATVKNCCCLQCQTVYHHLCMRKWLSNVPELLDVKCPQCFSYQLMGSIVDQAKELCYNNRYIVIHDPKHCHDAMINLELLEGFVSIEIHTAAASLKPLGRPLIGFAEFTTHQTAASAISSMIEFGAKAKWNRNPLRCEMKKEDLM